MRSTGVQGVCLLYGIPMTDPDSPQPKPPNRSPGCGLFVAVVLFVVFGLICLLVTYLAHSVVVSSSLPVHDDDAFTAIAVGCWTAWLVFLGLIARALRKRN
jgi:hypothetical protein